MKRVLFAFLAVFCLLPLFCKEEKQLIITNKDKNGIGIQVQIEIGEHWIHAMKLLGIFKIHNRPQIAVWIEDDKGAFVQNLYVTQKTAEQGWLHGPGDPSKKNKIQRYEALPYWMHKQNHNFDQGSLMPTKNNPLPELITSATPKKSVTIQSICDKQLRKFKILLEVNHSTDFNEYYSKNKTVGQIGFSGGAWGSGQPSIVYEADIDLNNQQREYVMKVIGSGCPDGSNGDLSNDLHSITTALSILKEARVFLN